MINIGLLYYRAARYDDAMRYFERGLLFTHALLSPGHPDEVKLLASMGAVQFKAHGAADAIPFYKKALELGESALGPEHPIVGEVLLSYAVVLRQAKQRAAAKICQRRAETILKAAARNRTIDVGDLLRSPTLGIHQ